MPKELRHTLVLLAIASCFLGAGIWQAEVAQSRDSARRSHLLPPSAKTKRAARPAPVPFSGDPVADYVARCQKGLTDQEILWILEDYNNAGLDLGIRDLNLRESTPPPEEPYRPYHDTLRKAQDRWFLAALVDGLRLSPEQTSLARITFDQLFDQVKSDFIKNQTSDPPRSPGDDPIWTYRGVERLEKLISPDRFLNDGVPWSLCPLSPQQEKLTWKPIIARLDAHAAAGQIAAVAPPVASETEFLGAEPLNLNGGDPNVPVEYTMPNIFLPFLKSQKLEIAEDPSAEREGMLLANVRKFHPAQLKICLLFDPDMADRLQRALQSASH